MRSEQEGQFRVALAAIVDALQDEMPVALQLDLLEHLARTDADGMTLCFNGPEREYLLDRFYDWLVTQSPETQNVVVQAFGRKEDPVFLASLDALMRSEGGEI